MRRAAALVVLVLVLAGCGEGAQGQVIKDLRVPRDGGGVVECVSQEHGLDCDWQEATR